MRHRPIENDPIEPYGTPSGACIVEPDGQVKGILPKTQTCRACPATSDPLKFLAVENVQQLPRSGPQGARQIRINRIERRKQRVVEF